MGCARPYCTLKKKHFLFTVCDEGLPFASLELKDEQITRTAARKNTSKIHPDQRCPEIRESSWKWVGNYSLMLKPVICTLFDFNIQARAGFIASDTHDRALRWDTGLLYVWPCTHRHVDRSKELCNLIYLSFLQPSVKSPKKWVFSQLLDGSCLEIFTWRHREATAPKKSQNSLRATRDSIKVCIFIFWWTLTKFKPHVIGRSI